MGDSEGLKLKSGDPPELRQLLFVLLRLTWKPPPSEGRCYFCLPRQRSGGIRVYDVAGVPHHASCAPVGHERLQGEGHNKLHSRF